MIAIAARLLLIQQDHFSFLQVVKWRDVIISLSKIIRLQEKNITDTLRCVQLIFPSLLHTVCFAVVL